MKIFSAAETHALLPYVGLADALREVLRASEAGTVAAPARQAVALAEGGTLLLMPATGAELGIVKLVTVHPGNAARGWPSVQGEVLVLDAATGERLYLLDGAAVTARRTAALSLLAAQMLAPRRDGVLLIIGTGVQGRAHLDAFTEGLGITQVVIASRTLEHAEALAAYARGRGLDAQAVADPAERSAEATLIVTATTSAQPVLPAQLREDVFIAAVGAYRPEMAEIPTAVVARCRIYVDTLDGAQHEAGDLIQADVRWSDVTPLRADLPRPSAGPILFKSVGHALWDLAAAQLVHREVRAAADTPPS